MVHTDLTFVTRKDENGDFLPFESRRKVFISYKKSDNQYGIRDKIAAYVLSALDCAVWYDASLTPGLNYDEEISEALKASDAVILLLTPQILSSAYVWDIEIRQAQLQHKGIIPILLGLEEKHLCQVEARLGHLQLLDGTMLLNSQTSLGEKDRFVQDLSRALHQFFLKQDLAMCVSAFFAAKKHLIPTKALSVEQLYYMSFGFLNGVGTQTNISEAVELMQSLLQLYTTDRETVELKAEITCTLIRHYVNIGQPEKAKEFLDGIDRYQYGPLYYYAGSLYEGILEKDPQAALDYYLKGSQEDHLPSVTAAAKALLQKKNIPQALLYFEKAAELGGVAEFSHLLQAYWNDDPSPSAKTHCCRLLAEETRFDLKTNRAVLDFLETVRTSLCFLRTCPIRDHPPVTPQQQLGRVEMDGHSFFLLRDPVGEKQNNMLLLRDEQVLYEFPCWAYGFGDMDFFDIAEENGYIVVKTASFCHYDGETNLSDLVLLNPLSGHPLFCDCRFRTECGRASLPYAAY